MDKIRSWRKWIGVSGLALAMVLSTLITPIVAANNSFNPVSAPEEFATIDPTLMPRGANMDELVEVIIQFEGDPVLKLYTEAKGKGLALGKEKQKEHGAQLQAAKSKAKAKVNQNGGKVISSFEKAYNGLFAQVKRSALQDIAEMSNVTGIYAVQPIEFNNETSVPFIGAPEVWEKTVEGLNVTGQGVTVAVIDTGIDYTHAAFGGAGTREAYQQNDPTVIEEGTFPTAKVVGGWDFVGTYYDASSEDPALRVPHPDPDPIDEAAHGTHVAATIAGMEVPGKIGAGVAPDALLYAYKVFGVSGSTGVVTQALEMAVDPNGDGDVSDHVDVVNMSLGSPYGHPDDPSAVATNNAVEAGIVVVASAGNSGNVPYITGSPAVAQKAISVAASIDDGVVVGAISVNSPASIAGDYEAVEGAITTPLKDTGPITNDIVYVGRGCNGDPALGDPSGQIALIDRGVCPFTEKLTNAKNAGAIAAIVANNAPGDPITMGGDNVDLPGVMVSLATGNIIKSALNNGEAVNVTLSDDNKVAKPFLADTMASFSSKGPGRSASGFKPEVSAPGFDIYSAAFGTGDEGRLMSGTSMAAPHVAGVAALLRQLHPDWSTDEIKSLIMNTSTPIQDLNGSVYPLSRQGAGRVQVNVAAETTSVVAPQALSLGYVPVEKNSMDKSMRLTVTNKGTEDKTYQVSWENRHGSQSGAVNVSVPSTLSVKGGKKANLNVKFNIDSSQLPNSVGFHEVDGYVLLTETSSGEMLRVPYQGVVQKVSKTSTSAKQDSIQLENKGAMNAKIDLFRFDGPDNPDRAIPDEYDLRATGTRVFADVYVAEFAVATHGPWATPNTVEFDIYIDNDFDGNPDWIIFNYDYYAFFGLEPIGQQISVGYNVSTGSVTPLYFVNVGGKWNSSVMGLPAPINLVAPDGQFQYMVVSFGRDSEAPDFNDRGWVKVDTTQPNVSFDSATVNVAPGESLSAPVTFTDDGKDVLVITETDQAAKQYSVVEFE